MFLKHTLYCSGLALVLSAASVAAHEIKSKIFTIDHPWVRATPKGVAVTAGYLSVTNTGTIADRLIGAKLTGAGAGELHETKIEDGITKMRPLRDGIALEPGQTITLEPSGRHIMFLDLKTTFEADSYVDGQLMFANAGEVPVEFFVEASAGRPHRAAPDTDAESSGKTEHRH